MFSCVCAWELEPCTGRAARRPGPFGPGSIILKSHWAGPGRVFTGPGRAGQHTARKVAMTSLSA